MYHIALRIITVAFSIAVRTQLIEYILPLIASHSLSRHKSEIEHCSQASIMCILTIGRIAQVDTLVVLQVVGTIEGVLHRGIRLIRITIIECAKQSDQRPTLQLF